MAAIAGAVRRNRSRRPAALDLCGLEATTDELLAAAYAYISGVPMTGLRLFAIYGPRGRPDMFYYTFTKAILEGRPIKVYTTATSSATSPMSTMPCMPSWPRRSAPCNRRMLGARYFTLHRIINIGNDHADSLADFIGHLSSPWANGRQPRTNR